MKRDKRCGARLIAVLLLILTLIGALFGCVGFPTRNDPSSETTGERTPTGALIDLLSDSDTIPAFNKTVLEQMHRCYSRYYIGELGSDEEMAASIAGFYDEYRNLIDETDADEVTDLLCEGYIYAAGDKYAYYMNAEAYAEYKSDISGSYVGIGVQVINDSIARTITVTAVFPDTPAYEAGVLAGDTIEAVGETPVSAISFTEAVNRIRGEEGTEVTVTFGRGGETYTRTMIRRTVTQVTASASILPGEPKIGVLRIVEFDKTTVSQFKNALDELLSEGVEGIVFDLRDNPGGLLASILSILDYLVPDGTPLANYLYYDGSTASDSARDGHRISPDLPISVICNAHTASAGELFTCALKDYGENGLLNVTVVGTVTFGKGTMQTLFEFNDGRATTISYGRYNPPYSDNYEGTGVLPSPGLTVELPEEARGKSIYALTPEEDTQMQAAVASVTGRIETAVSQ